MNPQFDLVMPLLNVPFSRRSEIEKRQILASVADALQEHANVNKILYNENVRKNRLLATYLIDVTLLLGKQELAFRGHDETEISVTGLFCKLTHIITVTLANDNRRNNDFFLKAILY
jgi:hypothetical protein